MAQKSTVTTYLCWRRFFMVRRDQCWFLLTRCASLDCAVWCIVTRQALGYVVSFRKCVCGGCILRALWHNFWSILENSKVFNFCVPEHHKLDLAKVTEAASCASLSQLAEGAEVNELTKQQVLVQYLKVSTNKIKNCPELYLRLCICKVIWCNFSE